MGLGDSLVGARDEDDDDLGMRVKRMLLLNRPNLELCFVVLAEVDNGAGAAEIVTEGRW